MKLTHCLTISTLCILPASSGDDVSSSAKGGLDPDSSAKDAPKGVLDPVLPAPDRQARWSLGTRLSWRNIGSVRFDTAASSLTVPRLYGMSSFTPPPGIGPETGLVARNYDDGFVNPGPRAGATGRTTDYGYDEQRQIEGSDLVFSATGGERRVVTDALSSSTTGWDDDREWEISPYLSLSRLTDYGNGWSVGPSFHFSFTNVDGRQGNLSTLAASERLDVYDVRAIDRFDSTGLRLPNAPYVGSPGAIAPLLPIEPFDRAFEDTLASSDLAIFSDSINESLDVNLFGLSVGGEAFYQPDNGRFLAGVGAGVVVNFADWEANRSDRLIQVTNGGAPVEIDAISFRNSGTDVLVGLYLEAVLRYQINQDWSVEANARYDWNESLRNSVGGSDFDVDLSGLTLGVGARYHF